MVWNVVSNNDYFAWYDISMVWTDFAWYGTVYLVKVDLAMPVLLNCSFYELMCMMVYIIDVIFSFFH